MGGPEGTNLLEHFEAEIDWTGVPITREYDRVQREYAHPARQNPFSGFSYYEARPTRRPTPAPTPAPTQRQRAIERREERINKEAQKTMSDWDMFTSSYKGIKNAARAWKMYKHVFPHAGMKREMDTTMTKDMIIGPHRKKRLGTSKRVNVGQQLKQLVDDTKVFKQQFKFKLTSGDGLRNWAQVVCRHRQTPGMDDGAAGTTFKPGGVILSPDVMADVPMNATTHTPYYAGLPPVPIGGYNEGDNYWQFGQLVGDDAPKNLLFLNMPLTFLEQDMFNMCLGPGKRDFTQYMLENGRNINENATDLQTELDTTGNPTTAGDHQGITTSRLTTMMQTVKPRMQFVAFEVPGSQVNKNIMEYGTVYTNHADSAARDDALKKGWNTNRATYPFQKGWGIHLLDYNLLETSSSISDQFPDKTDPQWIKTNNSFNTKATIKSGKISLSFNNMGESQCYITTLVVVNKHVEDHYYSMPQALTDQYLKCAQKYIDSGEWSITNNVTDPNQSSNGEYADAYMHVTHPSIKPFGKVPARFLEEFYEHFTIKEQRTTKLGIGERQSVAIDLGGLTYTTEQIAMSTNQQLQSTPPNGATYLPVEAGLADSNGQDIKAGLRAVFPLCCQQGTTHFLFGLQGMSLPYVSDKTDAQGNVIQPPEPDVTSVHGRWAVPALVDISGTYTEVIGPLQVVPKNPTPRQRAITALPHSTWKPIVTTLPRMRTTTTGNMQLKLT